MSDKPPLFKQRSSKAKPSQRAREDAVEVTAPSQGEPEEAPSALAAKIKTKAKRAKPKTQLSFGGADEEEGDGEVFQLKKSSLSQKLTFGKNAASPSASLISETVVTSSSRPTYDQAYLNELKASTPSSKKPSQGDTDMVLSDSMSMDVDEIGPSAIPSESMIKSAKEKREKLRVQGGQDDFISLAVTKRSEDDGPHPESRLMREEDDLGEGDDEYAEYTSAKERIALGKKSRKAEAKSRRDAMKELIEEAEDPDPEAMEWEQEQLKRGGLRAESAQPAKKTYVAATIPPTTSLPTLNAAVDRLAEALTKLTTSHATHSTSIVTLAEDRKQLDERESELRKMVESAETKRGWFTAYREWVESLAIFLDEKFPQLERVEQEHLDLLRERANIIAKRRKGDDADDLEAIYGALPKSSENGIEQLDEFGREVLQPTAASRRAQRLARRAKRQTLSKSHEEEGYSTDSSLASSDGIAYRNAADGFSTKREEILSDVQAIEFRDPANQKGIAGWWGTWRERWGDSYVGAWGGLGLVGAWEFWARLEIAGWDCIEDSTNLHTFKWYQGLYDYSRSTEDGELGPEGDLPSSMVSTAIIPRICKLLENGVLDVYSEKAIRRMIDLTDEISANIEGDNVKVNMLLQAVKACFAKEASSTSDAVETYLNHAKTRPALGFNPEAIPARLRVLARMSKLLQNALRWRKQTGEVFGIGEICTTIARLCVKVAEGGLQVGGLDALQKIHKMLPSELIPYEINAYVSL